jgi:glycosyltransferase involved in cell wall biosynthesis
VSTPSFIPIVERFSGRRDLPCAWLPVPGTVALLSAPAMLATERKPLGDAPVVGYFGCCNALVGPLLEDAVRFLLAARRDVTMLLFGRDTDTFARRATSRMPAFAGRIIGMGEQPAPRISLLIQCCDVMLQPYPDGVSARRTTVTTLLQHGTAIVTGAGARTETFWSDGEPGLSLVKVPGPEPLAIEVLRLLDSPDARRALARRARAVYDERFDVRHAVAALTRSAMVSDQPVTAPRASTCALPS